MLDQDDERRIAACRQEIDAIDTQLLGLLNRRAECALTIGEVKKRNNEPIFVPEREQSLLQRLASLNEGPLPDSAIVVVYQAIMNEMKRLEENS